MSLARPELSAGRRGFLAGAAATIVAKASAASAAPPLSQDNFGLTYGRAVRGNAWLEIDATAFRSNIAAYRRLVGPAQKSCVVVKGDAYGNGLALLMPTIMEVGLDFLGVASNDEARVVRAAGFRGRLMRLRAATLPEIEDGLRYRIEELIGSAEVGAAAGGIARRRGRALPFHLALNSAGMSREGIDLTEPRGRDEALALASSPHLSAVGVMAHFPVNEIEDMTIGLARFRSEADWLVNAAHLDRSRVALHCANSFATLNLPAARLDLVRPGRALFGYGGPAFPQFSYLSTLKSRVASIHRYPKGASVSYERTFELQRESVLANIPLGASDGFRPVFSHGNRPEQPGAQAHLVIRGVRAPVVGRVTMNTLMVDVTEIQDRVGLGDEVIVFGPGQPAGNSQADFLAMAGTNPPDLITVLGNSLPKVLKPAPRSFDAK